MTTILHFLSHYWPYWLIFCGVLTIVMCAIIKKQRKPIEETDLLEEDHDCEYWDKIKLVPRDKDNETYPKEYDLIY